MRGFLLAVLVVAMLLGLSAFAQEAPKQVPISPSARIRAAKTAFLKSGDGSDFPYKLIESSLTGWGRFALVDSPEKADVIIEVSAPYDESGISVSSGSSRHSPLGGSTEQPIKTNKDAVQRILLTVYDAHSNARLWFATERPKSSMKQKLREDNIVEASQQLFSKFRDVVDPPPPAQ